MPKKWSSYSDLSHSCGRVRVCRRLNLNHHHRFPHSFGLSNLPLFTAMTSKQPAAGRVSSSGRIRKPSVRAKESGDVKGLTIPLSSPATSPAKASKGTLAAYINKKKSKSPTKTSRTSLKAARPVAPLPQRAVEVRDSFFLMCKFLVSQEVSSRLKKRKRPKSRKLLRSLQIILPRLSALKV